MMRLGSVEVPEIENRLLSDPRGACLVHLPTGYRLAFLPGPQGAGRDGQTYYGFASPEEGWTAEVMVGRTVMEHDDWVLAAHFGMTEEAYRQLTIQKRRTLKNEYARTVGWEDTCHWARPADPSKLDANGNGLKGMPPGGSPPLPWDAKLRDILVLLLMVNRGKDPDTREPEPVLLHFRPDGVPRRLHADIRNPIWERSRTTG